jgi:sugar phosphate isomerase/epimerase
MDQLNCNSYPGILMPADRPQDIRRPQLSRRRMLCRSVQILAALPVALPCAALSAAPEKRRFKIGACDWSLGKQCDPQSFELAKQIGLDGVQVSLGTAQNDMHLRKKEVQQRYREAASASGLEIASLAIGELNSIPYKSDPRAIEWVSDSIDVCQSLGLKVVLLAFFSKGDLRGDKTGVDEVVRRLTAVAPKAEKAGVSLGIESWMSAQQHLEIIDRIGSSAVRVYYDLCNSTEMGYDICQEIRTLKNHICEFHAKENGSLLGHGKIDFRKVRRALDDINYQGWIQIEGAVPSGKTVLESYQANCKFLREVLSIE